MQIKPHRQECNFFNNIARKKKEIINFFFEFQIFLSSIFQMDGWMFVCLFVISLVSKSNVSFICFQAEVYVKHSFVYNRSIKILRMIYSQQQSSIVTLHDNFFFLCRTHFHLLSKYFESLENYLYINHVLFHSWSLWHLFFKTIYN